MGVGARSGLADPLPCEREGAGVLGDALEEGLAPGGILDARRPLEEAITRFDDRGAGGGMIAGGFERLGVGEASDLLASADLAERREG